ncbi:MAG: stage V sporulation protein AD [Clostridia bacterium]|nr:stage V sporulation protein AD [Clostridia bacterium]
MRRIIEFKNKPCIIATAAVCGPKESESNLSEYFDLNINDEYFGEKSFELAERKMLKKSIEIAVKKSKISNNNIDVYIGGDLLDQIISSSFCAREFPFPFLGVYTACSTMGESLLLGAMMIDGGYLNNAICATSSHFSTAERQYRFPLEQGTTRPAQAQWTVTGAGASVLSKEGNGIKITSGLIGRVVDYGIKDTNNMGAAMAPAVVDSLGDFFEEKNVTPNNYDMILTGDLGTLGSRILKDLIKKRGFDIDKNHLDCGELIYNLNEKEYSGGSGAGCSAVVFNSYIYKMMLLERYKKILFVPTGALLSTLSSQQGESIPGIANVIELSI